MFVLAATPALAEEVTVLAFGDSLTHGYGLPPAEGFVPQLEAWLNAHSEDQVTVVNAGVSGDTTAGGKARIAWSLSDDVDVVIVELGANDLLRGIDPGASRANLDAVLAEISSRELPILLAGMPAPSNYGPDYQRDFDAIYPELAQKYGAVLYPNFLSGLGQGTDLSQVRHLMQADGVHPNAEGVGKVVDAIGPTVLQLIGEVEPGS